MSHLGTIEKLNVANVLQRIETHSKTGLLFVWQDKLWVELYCHEGRLWCIGPIRTNATLGERLLQDGIISAQALQETMQALGNSAQSETQIALTLMDLGYVTREELRAWTWKKTGEVLSVILSWSAGEFYFKENADAPAERLLVSLSISSLLAAFSPRRTSIETPVTRHVAQQSTPIEGAKTTSDKWDIAQSPTLYVQNQFRAEPTTQRASYSSPETLLPVLPNSVYTGPVMPPAPPQTPPPTISAPVVTPPIRRIIDTSFMQPTMVLVPADLSALAEQEMELTPEQWRILTRVDGLTSLQNACIVLNMRAEDVCRVAGELIAMGIVRVVYPSSGEVQEVASSPQHLQQSGFGHGLATPGYAAALQSPWGTMPPVAEMQPLLPPTHETYSQWGNGGNGATFVQGQGWVAQTQPVQPLQTTGSGNLYTSVGGRR